MPNTDSPERSLCARRRLGVSAWLLWAAAWVSTPAAAAAEPDPFDAIPDLEAQVNAVNEGELHFLPPGSAAGAHAHRNQIAIRAESLEDGWVSLVQCHENLDAVPAAQVVYNAGRIRDLAILSTKNIGQAWVDRHTVQLKDVGKPAELCVGGESRALTELAPGAYRLRSGPYMRKFLDGYYPMRVMLDIAYPPSALSLGRHVPAQQDGFAVQTGPSRIQVDASFEGRLFTCFDFCAATDPACMLPEAPCDP